MVLFLKVKQGLVVVDMLDVKDVKIKVFVGQFVKVNWGKKVFVIDGEQVNEGFVCVICNIVGVNVFLVVGVNVYDILKYDILVFMCVVVEKLEVCFNG